jgi:hypothetical protein
MNELITLLALKASGATTGWLDRQKFAELIIKECIGVVENLSPGYKDYRDQIEDAFRRDCVEEIKHKFGVKE